MKARITNIFFNALGYIALAVFAAFIMACFLFENEEISNALTNIFK